MKFWLLVLTLLGFASCQERYSDFFPYYDNGTKKPFVSYLPMYDSIDDAASHDFARELGYDVRELLKEDGSIYCLPQQQDAAVFQEYPLRELAKSEDLQLFSAFEKSDYIVVTDLFEYQIVPYKRQTITPLYVADLRENEAQVVKISVHLNIIDKRMGKPRFIRREIVRSNHMVPKEKEKINFAQIKSRLARDIKEKIEITLCAKK